MDTAQITPTDTAPEPRKADIPVTFMSRRRDLYLVVVPGREALDALHRTYTVHGDHLEFKDSRLTTDDLDTIEWLRAHDRFNDPGDGFFEIEPDVPQPEGELLDLAQAGVSLDDEKVNEVLEREHATWGREIVIRTAEATLTAIAQQKAMVQDDDPPPADPPVTE